jgi:hypothetical protein
MARAHVRFPEVLYRPLSPLDSASKVPDLRLPHDGPTLPGSGGNGEIDISQGFSQKADTPQAASEARASFLRHEDQARHSGKRTGEEAKVETGRKA